VRAAASFSGAVDTRYVEPASGIGFNVFHDMFGTPDDRVWGNQVTDEATWRDHNPTDRAADLNGVALFLASGTGTPGGPAGDDPSNPGGYFIEQVIFQMNLSFTRALDAATVPYVESHAGEGRYALGPTGEWTEGIGRLWAAPEAAADDAVGRYVGLCRRLGRGAARPQTYPGSPVFARAVLGPDAALTLWERDAGACTRLEAELRGDPHARVRHGDGLAALAGELRAAEERAAGVVALVDPSWTAKADWSAVPEAVIAAARASTRACIALWYPLKSLTRPNAMLARFDRAGVGATTIELVTTPLGARRPRL